HLVGGDDELHVGKSIGEPDEHLLVGRPGAARHEYVPSVGEILHHRQAAGLAGYPAHPVETGIPGHGNLPHPDSGQQFLRFVILHEKPPERPERPAERPAPQPEKDRIAAEYGGYDIGGNPPAREGLKIVQPEFVFYEHGDFRCDRIEESLRIAGRVRRQVKNPVRSPVILPYFVTGRRKEGEEYPITGIPLPYRLDDGSSLFEFSERCGVYPHNRAAAGDGTLQFREKPLP